MLQQNFAYIFEKKAYLHPDDVAVTESYNAASYTYDALQQRANRLANALVDAGIRRGERLCCLTTNSVEYIDIFTAAARVGAILCPLNYRLAPVEIIKILQDAKPKAFIFDFEFAGVAQEISKAIDSIHLCLCFGAGKPDWAQNYEDFMNQYPSKGPEIEGDSEDTLLLLYTAGSTGRPKGVPLKQTNLFFNAINWIIDVGITKQDYTLTIIPLFHIGGHMLWTLPHLIVGAKVMLQRRFSPEEALRNISQEGITNTYFIPAMAKMVLALPNWRDHNFANLRFIGAGGEAVAEKITRAFGELGVPILNSYGLTETSDGTIGMRPPDVAGKPANCIGKSLTLTDTMIIDPNGREAAVGKEGELLHRGPSVVSAYWNRPEESKKAFRDGWLHTGDLAVKDKDGFIYFLGRKDDMIVSGGENVYPAEVEEAILSHEKVADVAVLGVPNEKWGQTVKAIIAPKRDEKIDEMEILEHLKTILSGFKRPRIMEFAESLPKIGSGKLDRALIKKLYGKG
ncbi:MAG: AMP-binding protein [Desulfobacterales bacterium]|nr:MAG: AMP-binding protein [Desulfobacterales bacterium]